METQFRLPSHAFPSHQPATLRGLFQARANKILSESVREESASSISLALCGLPVGVCLRLPPSPGSVHSQGSCSLSHPNTRRRGFRQHRYPRGRWPEEKAPVSGAPASLAPFKVVIWDAQKASWGNQPDEPLKPGKDREAKLMTFYPNRHFTSIVCVIWWSFLCFLSRCFAKNKGLKIW